MLYSFKKAFVTGCDKNTEWMLPWFLENYRKHNNLPIVICDFGMTKEGREKVKNNFIIEMDPIKHKKWFLKPKSMLECPSEYTCWIDTDCHVLGNIEDIFDYCEPNKLAMCEDIPWTQRRKEIWHNSGVVAFQHKPDILKRWEHQCRVDPIVGDQETLHVMLNPLEKMVNVTTLPKKYNVVRLQLLDNTAPEEILVMHWTGKKGKDKIMELMND